MAEQPVVTILGMLHLLTIASQRGDVEEDGRIFIAMEGTPSRQYLPSKIILYREEFPLFLQKEIQAAFAEHVFEAKPMPVDFYNEETKRDESSVADAVQNTAIQAWLSSPAAFKYAARSCSERPDKKRTPASKAQLEMTELFPISDEASLENDPDEDTEGFLLNHKADFKISQEKRKKVLIPLLRELEKMRPEEDDKFMRLKHVLTLHARQKHKVVIFVKRYTTAVYLLETLTQTNVDIHVGCTVQREENGCHLKSLDHRKDVIEHFCPRSSDAKGITETQETDVLICTDIDGVGINMQDACVVINYDLPLGADELFQRAGRVLRMTVERDRIVHLYTFEPALHDQKTQVATNIARRIKKLHERHDNSQGIVGGNILPNVADWAIPVEILLARPEDIISMPADLTLPEEGLQEEPNSDLTHRSVLERNAQKATDLPITILSAKNTTHHEPLVFVLLRHDGKPYLLLYAVDSQKFMPFTDDETLKFLQCDATEQKAIVRPQIVEKKALEAVEMWCQTHQLDPADCDHLCVIYLKPSNNQEQDLTDMLVGKSRN
ncbi:MAG: C-terminal helicase domain-containing protein [Janthinobacterium lividum]